MLKPAIFGWAIERYDNTPQVGPNARNEKKLKRGKIRELWLKYCNVPRGRTWFAYSSRRGGARKRRGHRFRAPHPWRGHKVGGHPWRRGGLSTARSRWRGDRTPGELDPAGELQWRGTTSIVTWVVPCMQSYAPWGPRHNGGNILIESVPSRKKSKRILSPERFEFSESWEKKRDDFCAKSDVSVVNFRVTLSHFLLGRGPLIFGGTSLCCQFSSISYFSWWDFMLR